MGAAIQTASLYGLDLTVPRPEGNVAYTAARGAPDLWVAGGLLEVRNGLGETRLPWGYDGQPVGGAEDAAGNVLPLSVVPGDEFDRRLRVLVVAGHDGRACWVLIGKRKALT